MKVDEYTIHDSHTHPIETMMLADIVAESSNIGIAKVGGGLFDVASLYGRDHVWSLTLGLRIAAGAPMHRMGRYGAAEEIEPMSMHAGMER